MPNNAPQIQWQCLPYSDLTLTQLYQLLQLRAEVFIVEQDCAFQDIDGLDPSALHLLGNTDGPLLAYARLLPPGVLYKEPSIGRVVTSPSIRGRKLGKLLMQESLTRCHAEWPNHGIRISAQQHLEDFYTHFGFKKVSEAYMEDGILHIEMLRPASADHSCRA